MQQSSCRPALWMNFALRLFLLLLSSPSPRAIFFRSVLFTPRLAGQGFIYDHKLPCFYQWLVGWVRGGVDLWSIDVVPGIMHNLSSEKWCSQRFTRASFRNICTFAGRSVVVWVGFRRYIKFSDGNGVIYGLFESLVQLLILLSTVFTKWIQIWKIFKRFVLFAILHQYFIRTENTFD